MQECDAATTSSDFFNQRDVSRRFPKRFGAFVLLFCVAFGFPLNFPQTAAEETSAHHICARKRFGGNSVANIERNAHAKKTGLENLILDSEFDRKNPKGEEHSRTTAQLENAEDVWIKNVTARHFAGSAICVGLRARRVMIENCRSENPVSEIGVYRRQSFLVEGQQVLVGNCYVESCLNDFAGGLNAAGPNVFLNCTAKNAHGASGAFESMAAGVCMKTSISKTPDCVSQKICRAQGEGWTAVKSVVWNSEAAEIKHEAPEGAENFSEKSNDSLFESQFKARIGKLPAASKNVAPVKIFQNFV